MTDGCFVLMMTTCEKTNVVHMAQVFMSPKLSIIALSIVPPVAILSRIYGRYVQNITKQVQDSLADATQVNLCVLLLLLLLGCRLFYKGFTCLSCATVFLF